MLKSVFTVAGQKNAGAMYWNKL